MEICLEKFWFNIKNSGWHTSDICYADADKYFGKLGAANIFLFDDGDRPASLRLGIVFNEKRKIEPQPRLKQVHGFAL